MKSLTHGRSTSSVEVTNISPHGFWLLYDARELFVPFATFPWFKGAELAHIFNVRLESPGHFHWPDLDVDVSEAILREPEKFRLVDRAGRLADGSSTVHEGKP